MNVTSRNKPHNTIEQTHFLQSCKNRLNPQIIYHTSDFPVGCFPQDPLPLSVESGIPFFFLTSILSLELDLRNKMFFPVFLDCLKMLTSFHLINRSCYSGRVHNFFLHHQSCCTYFYMSKSAQIKHAYCSKVISDHL